MDIEDVGGSRSYWSVYRRAQKQTAADLMTIAVSDSSCGACSTACEPTDDSHEANVCMDGREVTDCYTYINPADIDIEDRLSSDDTENITSDSDSSLSDHDDIDTPSITEQLAQWVLDFNINKIAVNKLLRILKQHFLSLPSDSRTLMLTPRTVAVRACGDGGYVHFGLEKGIRQALLDCGTTDTDIHVQINVDGLPLFKSSNTQFWPILCLLKKSQLQKPFVVGLLSGRAKPTVSFLSSFVDELQELMHSGMLIDGTRIHVKLHSFICDAPARAFIKCTKLHSGYSSCDRGDVHGDWCGKVVFAPSSGTPRTDEAFRSQTDDGHHLPNAISPLIALNVDMVSQFPLDPMHLLHLGVMRRLLLLWLRGPLTVRWPARVVCDLSSFVLSLGEHIPSEFCRQPRALAEIDRWKATEFRLFLLYCGVVVLRSFLTQSLYRHFLLLFVASTILSHTKLSCQFHDYAGRLLSAFVQGVAELYGKEQ